MRGEIAPDIPESSLYPPPFGDPPTKKPLPGGLCAVFHCNKQVTTARYEAVYGTADHDLATFWWTEEWDYDGDRTQPVGAPLISLIPTSGATPLFAWQAAMEVFHYDTPATAEAMSMLMAYA